MNIGWVQFTWAVGLFIAWNTFLFGAIWFLVRNLVVEFKSGLVKSIIGVKEELDDAKKAHKIELAEVKKQAEADRQDWKNLDSEFKQHLISMPNKYVLRDDSVREFTVINTKLDRLYELYLEQERLRHA